MATDFTWGDIVQLPGFGQTGYVNEADAIIVGSGSIGSGDTVVMPNSIDMRPYGSIHVVVTNGSVTGQWYSTNLPGIVGVEPLPVGEPVFTLLETSSFIDDAEIPVARANNFHLTPGPSGFTGMVAFCFTRRGE